MPAATVKIIISDWTQKNEGKKTELPDVSMDSSIKEIKETVHKTIGHPGDPCNIVLFLGTLHLEDERKLKEYNKSNRSKLSVNVYELVELNLRVRTLQHAGSGACVCVPLWGFLCRQTIMVKVADHETVGFLKQKVCEELRDPERYPSEKLKLTFGGEMLRDDKKTLKELGLKSGSTLTLFVDCCYWKKPSKKEEIQPDSGEAPVAGSEERGGALECSGDAQRQAGPEASSEPKISEKDEE